MQTIKIRLMTILGCLLLTSSVLAGELKEISNYIGYSEVFASAGQPTKKQIKTLAEAEFERIIYIALTTNSTALAEEDELVLKNNMQYLHVPVDFSKPSLGNFQAVAAALLNKPEMKTLLHCQINLRASTFSFLYRVIHLKVPIDVAKQDLDKIWVPDAVWFKFIKDTLAHYDMSHECDGCDWGERDFD